jgi:pimeloyl-ACP methyl ester carboxylesterase
MGLIPNVPGMLRRVLSGATRGAVNEAWGLAAAAALYPLGLMGSTLRASGEPRTERYLRTPVVEVHGWFHNRSGFFFMARSLRRRGFRWVYAMNYNPLGESIQSLAERLARQVAEVKAISGAPRVHLVGHSLGGLICRWYVQEMGGAEHVDHCVTIGTPHYGTYAAFLGIGEAAVQMRPGSQVLRRLEETLPQCPTRFLNLHSDLDALIVPSCSAVLPSGPLVTNRLIRDVGHLSMLISAEMTEVVSEHLADSEPPAPALPLKRTS